MSPSATTVPIHEISFPQPVHGIPREKPQPLSIVSGSAVPTSVSERHAAGKPWLQEQFEVSRCDDRPVGTHRDSGWTDSRRAVLHGDNQSEAIHDHSSGCTASSTTASSICGRCHQTAAVETRIHQRWKTIRAYIHPKAGCAD